MPFTRIFSCLALVALAAGCNTVRLADSVDLELNFSFLEGPSDKLHSPYVAGADFDVYSIGVDPEDEVGWTIASSDASVIAVRAPLRGGAASVSAVSPGAVDLIVNDEVGQEVHRATVEVIQPDRADVVAHGPLLVRRPELQPVATDEIQVLVGGSGTFLVEWYAGDSQLMGNGALTTESDPGVTAQPRRSFLFEDREWVTFTAIEPGRHEVRLLANGELTRTLTIVGVAEDAIDDVRLHGMDETEADEGHLLVVYAQAYAADDTPIYGVEYEWDLDGVAEPGLGDLFRYAYAPGVTAELCARHAELEAVATISAREGWVDSTNDIGCSVSSGGAGWMSMPAVAAFFAMLLVRRRYPKM